MNSPRAFPTTTGTFGYQPDTPLHMRKNVRLVRNGYLTTRSTGEIT